MVLLETGPGKALSSLLRKHPDATTDRAVINTMAHPREKGNALRFLMAAFAKLFTVGAAVDWAEYYNNRTYTGVALPGYPFDRTKCFITPDGDGTAEIDLLSDEQLRSRILPDNPTEEFLAGLWEMILGVSPIGVTDNFFELGGTSLMITRIVSGITERFGTITFTVEDMYNNQTVRRLAAYIDALSTLQEEGMETKEKVDENTEWEEI
jgi:acyl carrier protein